jgi:chromosome partitioning protein
MLVISLVSSKGGCGKSTLATNLGVQAARFGLGPLIIDLDPQATAWSWGQRREATLGKGSMPQVVASQAPALPQLLQQAREQGCGLVILDTPPRADTVGVQAAQVSDLVLVPCQPSDYDLSALSASMVAAQIARKTAYVVLNGAIQSSGITDAVEKALIDGGADMVPARVGLRMDFRHPLPSGRGAFEWGARGQAAAEIDALWNWICQQDGMAALQQATEAARQQSSMPASQQSRRAAKQRKAIAA